LHFTVTWLFWIVTVPLPVVTVTLETELLPTIVGSGPLLAKFPTAFAFMFGAKINIWTPVSVPPPGNVTPLAARSVATVSDNTDCGLALVSPFSSVGINPWGL
jgi:hypothetical protein